MSSPDTHPQDGILDTLNALRGLEADLNLSLALGASAMEEGLREVLDLQGGLNAILGNNEETT